MIEVKGLRKSFGPIVAVNDVSFSVEQGDVLGFTGPNGAGKTTTMRMLSCFLRPDAGTATVAGYDIIDESVNVRRNLGYLAENVPTYNEMTVTGFLKFVCDARGINRSERRQAIERIAETCAITGVMHQLIGTLSKGYRRRVGLAQTLIHDPPVLVLDEPTDGLDPNQKFEVRKLIKNLAKERCIIVSTHILEEVDAICNRMIVMDRGGIRADSTPRELREQVGGNLDDIFLTLTTGETSRRADDAKPEPTAAREGGGQ